MIQWLKEDPKSRDYVWFTVEFPAKRYISAQQLFVEFIVMEFLKVPEKSQDLTWVTCPAPEPIFLSGGSRALIFRVWVS